MLLAAVLSAWVQYAADGRPHARALAPLSCPALTYDGGSTPMRVRAPAGGTFDEIVCDAPLPDGARNAAVESVRLPPATATPRTIVVLGDTGCRLLNDEQQNCGDIADWPFPKIAQTIAALRPDLVVHVGDYYYRENNCPPSMPRCVNRWGDTSTSWNADWFSPAKPLFAAAPLLAVRGNHEDCKRGGPGWYRYLDAAATVKPCSADALDGDPPWTVRFDGLQIVAADSAADASDVRGDPARIAFYRDTFARAQALATGARGDTWFVTHRPPFANTNQTQALLAQGYRFAPFTLLLAGHVHDFEAIDLAGYPPLLVNGEGGDDLDDAGSTAKFLAGQVNDGRPAFAFAAPPYGAKQFGFAVYARGAAGWTISLRDTDGIERRTCLLARGAITCPG